MFLYTKTFSAGAIPILLDGRISCRKSACAFLGAKAEVIEIKTKKCMNFDERSNGHRKEKRGFAAMDVEKQRAIASKGGRAAHEKGTAHEFTPEEAREAGRKGGLARREHE